jgi:hypothetical protein
MNQKNVVIEVIRSIVPVKAAGRKPGNGLDIGAVGIRVDHGKRINMRLCVHFIVRKRVLDILPFVDDRRVCEPDRGRRLIIDMIRA